MVNSIPVNTGIQPAQPVMRDPASYRIETEAGSRPVTESDFNQQNHIAKKQTSTTMDDIKTAVKSLNEYTQSIGRTLAFSIDEKTGRTIIRVYDSKTEELIREIPPEETLRLAARMKEQLKTAPDGLLIRNQYA